MKWSKLSCCSLKDNQTRLPLFALAYNVANFLRRLALSRDVKHWTLTTFRGKLVKIGAKVTRHSHYVTFQSTEVAIGAERTNAMNNYRGLVDDFGIWDNGLNAGEAQAVYNLAVEPGLQYGVSESDTLFELFNAGTGETLIGDLAWENGSGLIGAAGDVLDLGGGEFALILNGNGNGVVGTVAVVPEPASIAIFSLLGLCLAGYGYRRQRRSK